MKKLKSLFLSLFLLIFSGFVFSQTTHSYAFMADASFDNHLLTVQPGDRIELINDISPGTFGIKTSQDGVNYTQILSGYMYNGVVFDTLIGQDNDNFYLRVVMADGTPVLTINVNVDNTASISSLDNLKFNVYPNPTQNLLTVSGTQVSNLSILDTHGRLLLQSMDASIDVSELPAGIYHVLVNGEHSLLLVKD